MSTPAHRASASACASASAAEEASSGPEAVDIAAVYRAHVATVTRWAARLGGPGIDVDDVVQDVFVVAKRRLSSFKGDGKITTWLFRTTEKVVQAARRKQRLRRWLSSSREAGSAAMGAPRATPGEALERDREAVQVYRALDRLPERERRVLILFEIEGLSTQEIAELVGARVGTVRVWLFRARGHFMEAHQRLFEPREQGVPK